MFRWSVRVVKAWSGRSVHCVCAVQTLPLQSCCIVTRPAAHVLALEATLLVCHTNSHWYCQPVMLSKLSSIVANIQALIRTLQYLVFCVKYYLY